MDNGMLVDILKFMAIAVLITPLCHKLRVSPILGYLAAGYAVGPNGLALISDEGGIRLLADMGIVFLLFVIGLRLSLERLRVIRHFVFGLGTAQVMITAAVLGIVAWAWGLPAATALVLGLSLSFSSTAFVLQILTEGARLNTRVGRVSVAILILQDMAVVPLLVLIPLLSHNGSGGDFLVAFGLASAKATAGVVVIFLVARLALRPLFRVVAATHSPDAFIAAVLLAAIGTAYATALIGLSLSLGAFLAGILLASTEFRHQVEADILPIRGLLLGLFFLTIGMTINLNTAFQHWFWFLGGLLVLVVLKSLILTALCQEFRFPLPVALQIGMLLAQGGEFAFVTLSKASEAGMIPPLLSEQLVTIIAASMALTPLLASAGDILIRRQELRDAEAQEAQEGPVNDLGDLSNHVVIMGFGRVGQTIASVLRRQGIPFVAFDRNPHLVAKFRLRGEPVYFGGGRNIDILRNIGAERARAAVLTIDNTAAAELLLVRLVKEFPHLHVLVRARDRRHQKKLEQAGASAVVPETLEGSLQLAGSVLQVLGRPAEEIHGLLDTYRRNNYALIEESIHADGA
ncbi:MAG: cation:proton antiporter [Alphaproteobacteria bacterium]|nr:cation:proton antiporter [Alphaproteobacteria bacterium]